MLHENEIHHRHYPCILAMRSFRDHHIVWDGDSGSSSLF